MFKIRRFSVIKRLVLLTLFAAMRVPANETSPFYWHYLESNLSRISQSIFDLSQNPAFFKLANPANFSFYSCGLDWQNNAYRRHFDPEQVRNYDLDFYTIKNLNAKVTIASYAGYNQVDYLSQRQSLEKNFYDHYFAFADTTTGNLRYQGPRLGFLYNYSLTSKILCGLEINYGIEQGLKDIYTKCETILRDIDIKTGIGWDLPAIASRFGVYGRYFNRQGKYEAVQERIAPQVFTYFGYHVMKREESTDLIRKNDSSQGYGMGLNLTRVNCIWSDMTLSLGGHRIGTENTVTVGRIAQPQPRGYSVRSEQQAFATIQYFPNKKQLGFRLSYIYRDLADWATSGFNDVLILENRVKYHQWDFLLRQQLNSALAIVIGEGYEITLNDYREYIVNFNYSQNQYRADSFFRLQVHPTSITTVELGGLYSNYIPDFQWDIKRFLVIGFQTVVERLTKMGVLGFDLDCRISLPAATNCNNLFFRFSLFFQKNY
jgi:hypothetical protein